MEGKVLPGSPQAAHSTVPHERTQAWDLARLLPATITTPMKICEWTE